MNYYNPYNNIINSLYYTRPYNNNQYSLNLLMPAFNLDNFKKMVPLLSDNLLSLMVILARAKGISDNDILNGLNFINSLK